MINIISASVAQVNIAELGVKLITFQTGRAIYWSLRNENHLQIISDILFSS